MIGFATLLEGGADRGPPRSGASSHSRSARPPQHLLAVINDLLDLSKAAAGRFRIRLAWGYLRPAVQGACASMRSDGAIEGTSSSRSISPPSPLEAAVDPARIRQVILNLLGNAVKFTDRGDVRVRGWRDDASPGDRGSWSRTPGSGSAPEAMPRLFTKFAQADRSYHRRHRGTGLGLAISRALVENMGGTIAFDERGRGRRHAGPPRVAGAHRGRRVAERHGRANPDRRRRPDEREALPPDPDAEGGVQVEITEDPERVRERALRGRRSDVIILDVSLSNSVWGGVPVDGLEICRRLKRDPKTAGIPVLLATAHAMKGSRENFLSESGADEYISKPIVSSDELIDMIRALARKGAHGTASPPR